MRISDWSSDVCSSDLHSRAQHRGFAISREEEQFPIAVDHRVIDDLLLLDRAAQRLFDAHPRRHPRRQPAADGIFENAEADVRFGPLLSLAQRHTGRSEEHTSELPSLMRNSYAV